MLHMAKATPLRRNSYMRSVAQTTTATSRVFRTSQGGTTQKLALSRSGWAVSWPISNGVKFGLNLLPDRNESTRGSKIKKLVQGFASRTFSFWERCGLHVTPVHFYQPIPYVAGLSKSIWNNTNDVPGVALRLEQQMKLLETFKKFKSEYESLPRTKVESSDFFLENGMFESVDAEVLYCMIRLNKPKRIVEIGGGFSTILMAEAILDEQRSDPYYECEILTIEPYPSSRLRAKLPSFARLIERPVETLPMATFDLLESGDILFIDSSHVLKVGGDVQFEFLRLIPRIAPGVLVHVHDIFLPDEYPAAWIRDQHRFYTEQYLLQAFLAFNDSFNVVWSGSAMASSYPEELGRAFDSFDCSYVTPGSFWFARHA